MDIVSPRELSLKDLEAELQRVKKAREVTEQFLNSLNSLSDQKVTELENLKANLELLKSFEKKEDKEKFIQKLNMRETNLNKAIQHMKVSGSEKYDPRKVQWDSN